jgi:hypothetical protein
MIPHQRLELSSYYLLMVWMMIFITAFGCWCFYYSIEYWGAIHHLLLFSYSLRPALLFLLQYYYAYLLLLSNDPACDPPSSLSFVASIIIKSTQGRVVNPLRDLVISLDLPVLQLRELINWQVKSLLLVMSSPCLQQKFLSVFSLLPGGLILESELPLPLPFAAEWRIMAAEL